MKKKFFVQAFFCLSLSFSIGNIFAQGCTPTWTTHEGMSYTNTDLYKTASSGMSNSQAISANTLIGDGSVSFTVTSTSHDLIVGLNEFAQDDMGYYNKQFALEMWGGNVWVAEGSSFPYFTGYQPGDIFTIERIGTTISYKVNGIPYPYTSNCSATANFVVQVSIESYCGQVNDITYDFCNEFTVSQNVNSASDCSSQDGSISTTVNGITPFTYLWDDGSSLSNRYNLGGGNYTVTVTDAMDRVITKNYSMSGDVQWNDLQGLATASNGSLVKTASEGWGNSNGVSLNTMNGDGEVSFTVSNMTDNVILGLATTNHGVSSSYYATDFTLETYYGQLWLNEGNAYVEFTNYQVGDVFTLKREAGLMTFLKNGTPFNHTHSLSSSIPLIIEAKIHTAGGQINNIQTSFCDVFTLNETVNSSSCSDANGSIIALPVNEAAPVAYSWNNGQTINCIYNLPVGDYTLDATDALGRKLSRNYTVHGSIEWTNLEGIQTAAQSSLVKTNTGTNNSKAISLNTMNGSGNVVFEAANITDNYIVGISTLNHGPSTYMGAEYAFEMLNGTVAIMEGDAMIEYTTYETGDKFEIALENGIVHYFKNDVDFGYTSTTTATDFIVEAAINTNGGTIKGLEADFCGRFDVVDITSSSAYNKGTGSVELSIANEFTPMTYLWSNGGQTASIYDLTPGDYTVAITDKFNRTFNKTFTVGGFMSWVDGDNITTSANHSITKSGASGKYNNSIASQNTLIGDGWFSVEITSLSKDWIIGFAETNNGTNGSYYTPAISIEMWYGQLWLNFGSSYIAYTYPNVGDEVKLERVGDEISLWHNNVQFTQTFNIANATPLLVEAKIDDANATIFNIKNNFANIFDVTASIDHASTSDENSGSIQLNLSGNHNYNVTWSNGSTAKDLLSIVSGTYDVSVLDDMNRTWNGDFEVGDQMSWTGLVGIEQGANLSLIKTAVDGLSNTAGVSSNILEGDGEISFVVEDENAEYVIGLSDVDHGTGTYYGPLFAYETWGGSMWISLQNSFPSMTSYEKGDRFTIKRVGTEIKFFKNNIALNYTGTTTATQKFIAEVSMNTQGGRIDEIVSDFRSEFTYDIVTTDVTMDEGGTVSISNIQGIDARSFSWIQDGDVIAETYDGYLNNLDASVYYVWVKDSLDSIRVCFEIGEEVFWSQTNGISQDGSNLAKLNGNVSWTDGIIESVDVLQAGEDGRMSFEIVDEKVEMALGFKADGIAMTHGLNDLRYGFVTGTNGKYSVVKDGLKSEEIGSYFAGDKLKVNRKGSKYEYSRNGTLVEEHAAGTSEKVKVHIGIKGIGKIKPIKWIPKKPKVPRASVTMKPGSCDPIKDGSIKVSFQHSWMFQPITVNILDDQGNVFATASGPTSFIVPPGDYTVQIISSYGFGPWMYSYQRQIPICVGTEITFVDLHNSNVPSPNSVQSNSTTGAASWASQNTMAPGEDGQLCFVLKSTYSSENKVIGFSTANHDQGASPQLHSVDYAIQFLTRYSGGAFSFGPNAYGARYKHADGTWSNWIQVYPRDKFKIKRENSGTVNAKIKYYRNGVEEFSTPVNGYETLILDGYFKNTRHGFDDLAIDFCSYDVDACCIDPTLIRPGADCSRYAEKLDPVCGCDGITYPSACIARDENGVSNFVMGSCDSKCNLDASFTYNTNGYQVTFAETVSGASSYLLSWDMGDGNTIGPAVGDPAGVLVSNPTHQFAGPGVYDIQLISYYIDNSNPSNIKSCVSVYCDTIIVDSCRLLLDFDIREPLCQISGDGIASVIAPNGQAPFTYLWDDGTTDQAIVGLDEGTYSVVVTDALGCSGTASVVLTNLNDTCPKDPCGDFVINMITTNVNCEGECNGSIELLPTGAGGSYTYEWFHDASITASMITGLCEGQYTVRATAANGCSELVSYHIIPMTDNYYTNTTVRDACTGLCTGEVDLFVIGGALPYTYSWSNGSIDNNQVELCPGSYTVVITDNNGCSITDGVAVNESDANCEDNGKDCSGFGATAAIDDANCPNECDGAIDATVSGGMAPYVFSWNNGDATEDVIGLCPGIYTLTAIDNLGCTFSSAYTVGQDMDECTGDCFDLVVTPTIVNSSCPTSCDGRISLQVEGAFPGLNITWSNGSTFQDAENLCPGDYDVIIDDGSGRIFTATYPIVANTANCDLTDCLTLSFDYEVYQPLCPDAGAAGMGEVMDIMGGAHPYTFSWDGSSTDVGVTSTALPIGTHTIEITDANGCEAIHTFTVAYDYPGGCPTSTDPCDALVLNIIGSSVSCAANCDGYIDLTVTGGTAPYCFLWNNGEVTEDVNNLCVGDYNVMMMDDAGCYMTGSFGIIEADYTLFTYPSDESCPDACDGAITAITAGGNGTSTYLWNNGESTPSIDNLCDGTYNVIATSGDGCTTNVDVVIATTNGSCPDPCAGFAVAVNAGVASCPTACDADIMATLTGGTGPISFNWDNGDQTLNIFGQCVGDYILTVVDDNGCSLTETATVTYLNAICPECQGFSAAIGDAQNALCSTICDGEISTEIYGGQAPYEFLWSDGQTAFTAEDLCAGTYTVDITDDNDCVVSLSSTIGDVNDPCPPLCETLESSAIVTDALTTNEPSCPTYNNGEIDLTTVGGTSPYTYNWINVGVTTEDLTLLWPGTYVCVVTDAENCEVTIQAVVGTSDECDNEYVAGICFNNYGAYVNVPSNGALNVFGHINNEMGEDNGGGYFVNNGAVRLTKDWTNNGQNDAFDASEDGLVEMTGGRQWFRGSDPTQFYDLSLYNAQTRKLMAQHENVDGILDLKDAELATRENILTVNTYDVNAVIRADVGFVSSAYQGWYRRWMNTSVDYPFYTGSIYGVTPRYRPLTIKPSTSNIHTYGVRFVNFDPEGDSYLRSNRNPVIETINDEFYHLIDQYDGADEADISMEFDWDVDGHYQSISHWDDQSPEQWEVTSNFTLIDAPVVDPYIGAAHKIVTAGGWNDYTHTPFSLARTGFFINTDGFGDTDGDGSFGDVTYVVNGTGLDNNAGDGTDGPVDNTGQGNGDGTGGDLTTPDQVGGTFTMNINDGADNVGLDIVITMDNNGNMGQPGVLASDGNTYPLADDLWSEGPYTIVFNDTPSDLVPECADIVTVQLNAVDPLVMNLADNDVFTVTGLNAADPHTNLKVYMVEPSGDTEVYNENSTTITSTPFGTTAPATGLYRFELTIGIVVGGSYNGDTHVMEGQFFVE